MPDVSSSLERELRRMQVIARREQVRRVGRAIPRIAERRRLAGPSDVSPSPVPGRH